MSEETKKDFHLKVKTFVIKDVETLNQIEAEFRPKSENAEYLVWARNTDYEELAEIVMPDKDEPWKNPLYLIITEHKTSQGIQNLCMQADTYIREINETTPYEAISISAEMTGNRVSLVCLVRSYTGEPLNMSKFFDIIGEEAIEKISEKDVVTKSEGKLIIPDDIANFNPTEKERAEHKSKVDAQNAILETCTKDKPFLNMIDKYVPEDIPDPADNEELTYDLLSSDMKMDLKSSYEDFNHVFQEVMKYVSGTEKYNYFNVLSGENIDATEENFLSFIESHIISTYIEKDKFSREDLPAMMEKVNKALFKLYIVQDLIDDPDVTDIKITAPNSIRARVHGKAYVTNINFVDVDDYIRFVNAIAVRNHILQTVPEQTFTDLRDENYILRFSLTAAYVNGVPWPYLHIRKIDRHKPLADKLMELGMFDEKVRDYLLDCGKHSRGVVFAGPPGSGKTVCLNWFLEEAYEQSSEILVIQENDELFAYRKGVMFQHVVKYNTERGIAVSLEDLGQLALVAGANVFVIGEAKGAEICSAITLSNSGCRTALTIHSPSSTETLDKMADLAQRGYAKDIDQAKRMLRSFQTIVYLQDFKVQEISEITGYNEETKDMEYRYIYRRDAS